MGFWWKRYEPILEQRAKPARDVLKDLLAKELCEICEAFPPRATDVDWVDERKQARFAPVLETLPRVDLAMAELLSDLVAKDLAHEAEVIDHLFRNELHRAACPTPAHVEALHFLWPFLVEVLLTRKDEAQGALKNKDLVEIAERFLVRYRSSHPAASA